MDAMAPCCDNDPVNYVDPTGEIANIIAGGIAGGVIGGAFGFAGSAVSQLMSGERFSMRKALGSAANGAVVGAVRGAMVGSGIGIGTSLAANFIGGAVGSALEQKIGSGSVSLKESLVGGATNAVSGAIYGDGPLKGFGDALWKGAASGAATAGIRYLARDWDEGGSDLAGSVLGLAQGIGQMAISPYAKNRDPRRGCGVRSPLSNRIGEAMAYGYRYDVGFLKSAGSVRKKKEGFSMLGLLKEAAIGGVMGGLAGTAFYGAGKAVQVLKDSVRDVREAIRNGRPLSLVLGDNAAIQNAVRNAGPSTHEEFRVFGHGNENGIQLNKKILNADEVACLIRGSEEYVGGSQQVILYACETGKNSDGFAQQLANNLGVNVKAPNKLLYPTKTGGFIVAGNDYHKGKWITFTPKN